MSCETAQELQGLMDEPADRLIVWHQALARIGVCVDEFTWDARCQLPDVVAWTDADGTSHRAALTTSRNGPSLFLGFARGDRFVRVFRDRYARPIAVLVAELVTQDAEQVYK